MSIQNDTNKPETRFNFSSQSGGKAAITRLLQAYGFSNRQALCGHLGVSQSTMANRWGRDTFPHDWLIACHLDTGASLLWLAQGIGAPFESEKPNQVPNLEIKEITNGVFSISNFVSYDSYLLPEGTKNPHAVKFEHCIYVISDYAGEINDGVWLIEIDGLVSVREVYRFPGGKLRIENGKASFECNASDIKALGKVVSQTKFME